MIKQLIRSPIGNALVGWTAGAIIAMLMVTVRWRAHNDRNIKDILRQNNGVVLVFWHERLLACHGYGRQPFHCLHYNHRMPMAR